MVSLSKPTEAVDVRYSLYHRAGNPRMQTDEDARKIVESSVLRGYAPQGSAIPTVQAWPGSIPAGEYGLEFETDVSPDPRSPPGVPIWQRNYYERIIRNEQEMDRITRYIESNPTRWADDDENPN